MAETRIAKLKRLEKTYKSGHVLFSEDELSYDMYILMEGEVDVIKDGVVIANLRHPGTYIGEMSAILGEPRSATCKCRKMSTLICVPKAQIEKFFASAPNLAFKLSKILAERVSEMSKRFAASQEELKEIKKRRS